MSEPRPPAPGPQAGTLARRSTRRSTTATRGSPASATCSGRLVLRRTELSPLILVHLVSLLVPLRSDPVGVTLLQPRPGWTVDPEREPRADILAPLDPLDFDRDDPRLEKATALPDRGDLADDDEDLVMRWRDRRIPVSLHKHSTRDRKHERDHSDVRAHSHLVVPRYCRSTAGAQGKPEV